MEMLTTADTFSELASIGIRIFGNVGSLIFLLIEMFILKNIGTQMYGLRFAPVYGQYFFFKSIVPEKKKLAFIYTILQVIVTIMAIVASVYLVIGLIGSLAGKNEIFEQFVFVFVTFSILAVASFIIRLLLLLDAAEKFGYSKYLGILFAFIQIAGDICMLVNTNKYNNNYVEYEELDINENLKDETNDNINLDNKVNDMVNYYDNYDNNK